MKGEKDMIKILNNIIPFKGFLAMTVWPFLFVRKRIEAQFGPVEERHESIHAEQQKEMLVIGIIIAIALAFAGCGWWSLLTLPLFFWWYVTEWFVRLVIYRNANEAYRNISFEQEAFANEKDFMYLSERKHFAWVRNIFGKSFNEQKGE